MSGLTVTVPEPVPDAGVTPSQLALSDAVQDSVPPPELLTVSVLAAGLAPPAVPLNASEAGETDSAGGDGGDGAPGLKATVAISHGVLAPVDTRAAGVSPALPMVSSAS